MTQINLNSSTHQTIYIYAGPGTCSVAITHTIHTLKQLIHPDYMVQTIGSEKLCAGNWVINASLLIMPGGADLLYARTLKGKGNHQIHSYVQNGGRYFGICAGAYYGSKKVVFAPGTSLEVVADRELAFFPDIAEGPTLKPWNHRSNEGAEAALLLWKGPQSAFSMNQKLIVYYNGGGHFLNAHTYPEVMILANYGTTPRSKAAIVEMPVGKGRVILSGVHCEFVPELFDMTDPFLIPVKKKLLPKDQKRQALMVHLLKRLNLQTKTL